MSPEAKRLRKLSPSVLDLTAFLILLVLAYLRGSPLGDPGIGWHLKAGEIMSSTGAIIRHDPFLFALPRTTEWVDDQWLADLIFFRALEGGGYVGLHLLTIWLAVLPLAAVLVPPVFREAPRSLGSYLALFAVILPLSIQWFTRPVLFSFLGFSLTYRFCHSVIAHPEDRTVALSGSGLQRSAISVFVLFATWANLHPGFLAGLVLLLILATDRTVATLKGECPIRECSGSFAIALLAAAATLFTPYGLALHRSIYHLLGNRFFMSLNAEWLPPRLSDPFFFPFYLLLFIGCTALWFGQREKLRLFHLLTFILFALLSLQRRRYIPFFALGTFIPLAFSLSALPPQLGALTSLSHRLVRWEEGRAPFRYSAIFGIILTTASLALGRYPGRDIGYSYFPARLPLGSIDWIRQHRPGRLFHSPNLGGMVIWNGWPTVQPFIDDRNQVVPVRLYTEYFEISKAEPNWQQLLQNYEISTLLLCDEKPLVKAIEEMQPPEWMQLYKDRNGCIVYGQSEPLPSGGIGEDDVPQPPPRTGGD